MTTNEFLDLVNQHKAGNTINIEAASNLNETVYETLCAFLNCHNGHILIGIENNGELSGFTHLEAEEIRSEFIDTVRHSGSFSQAIYAEPELITIKNRSFLHIYVPESAQVCRYKNIIYARCGNTNLDLTYKTEEIYSIYTRKNELAYTDKLTEFGMGDVRKDIIARVKKQLKAHSDHHPWLAMDDKAFLESAGLLRRDSDGQDCLTLAGALLFGDDCVINTLLPQYKVSTIFDDENCDSRSEYSSFATNLFEVYDRWLEFGRKHLNDNASKDNDSDASMRDMLLHELFANALAYNDYSSSMPMTFFIGNDFMYVESARCKDASRINNPALSRVFRELGMIHQDDLDYKKIKEYSKLYLGASANIVIGDSFKVTIPIVEQGIEASSLNESVELMSEVAAASEESEQLIDFEYEDDSCAAGISKDEEIFARILEFCSITRSKKEICEYIGYRNLAFFSRRYVVPLIESGQLHMTIPDKPNSSKQRYITAVNTMVR